MSGYRLNPDGTPSAKSSYDRKKDAEGTQHDHGHNPTQEPAQTSVGTNWTTEQDDSLFGHTNELNGQQGMDAIGGEEPITNTDEGLFKPDNNQHSGNQSNEGIQSDPQPEIHVPPPGPSTQLPDFHENVCGWLVVIEGPGKGQSITIGAGQSIVSRSRQQRICLNFGDLGITSGKQCMISFNKKRARFSIGPGDGANPTELNEEDVLSTLPLKSGDIIEMSQTKLRFVAFCDETFSWD